MKLMKRMGPIILPCGTPDVTVTSSDKYFLNFVCFLLVRYDLRQLKEFFSKPRLLSFCIKWL